MKASNVMKLEKYCSHFDESCFAGDHDSLATLTCQQCANGNEVVEKLLDVNAELLGALKNIIDECPEPKLPYGKKIVEIAKQ